MFLLYFASSAMQFSFILEFAVLLHKNPLAWVFVGPKMCFSREPLYNLFYHFIFA